jgi:hypothetical protein
MTTSFNRWHISLEMTYEETNLRAEACLLASRNWMTLSIG